MVRLLRAGTKLSLILALLVSIQSCRAPPSLPSRDDLTAGPPGAVLFRVDSVRSQAWLYLHSDGPLARLGHSHVIVTHGLRGSVWIHPQLDLSSCDLRLPVDTWVVDDPQERTNAGGEFTLPLDAAARQGTREHMLADQQLNAKVFPEMRLRCTHVRAAGEGVRLDLTVTLRGRDVSLAAPVNWQRDGNNFQASGEFLFKQTELGMEPYSALLGALRVADQIRARFVIMAHAH